MRSTPLGSLKNSLKNPIKNNIYPFFGETFEAPPNGIRLECRIDPRGNQFKLPRGQSARRSVVAAVVGTVGRRGRAAGPARFPWVPLGYRQVPLGLWGDIRGGSHWEAPRMSPQKRELILINIKFTLAPPWDN